MPAWRHDALTLRYAVGLPLAELADAHREAKAALLARVRAETGAELRPEPFTIGFARRATAYKRATLILQDPERLAAIAERTGPLQILFAGKAHPADRDGKALIERIFRMRDSLRGRIELAYLPDYDMDLAKPLVAGCDLWLNNPVPPLEASGTSGMKAALNGVPSLSIRDGWWAEGHVEGVTGWSIGDGNGDFGPVEGEDGHDASALYEKLELAVLPTYWGRRRQYLGVMRSAIALNASFFNTQRMVLQYLYEAYQDPDASSRPPRARREERAGEEDLVAGSGRLA
jgi:starch phosphorylase